MKRMGLPQEKRKAEIQTALCPEMSSGFQQRALIFDDKKP